MYVNFVKRLISILIASLGLIVLFPWMIIIAIIIRIETKGNAIFKQKRLGKNQKEFIIYKFRTMVDDAYSNGGVNTSEFDPRITKVGSILRKTSLDEIPQLINILLGQMSIIGPRPILKEEFFPFENQETYINRFRLRPGLFCTVDIDLRATATREVQFKMDSNYVNEVSFKLDLIVFLKTLKTVIKRKNVYRDSTMTRETKL